MSRLAEYVKRRHEIAKRYDELLADLPITLPWQHADSYSAYHLYVIRLQLDKIGVSHLHVFDALRAKDIMVNLHYIPVHTQPYYQNMGFKHGDYPQAEQYYREAISIPMHPTLTQQEQDFVVACIKEAIGL
jgi:dTDP-4-amino-4,6-dideoxygalactose transaminase